MRLTSIAVTAVVIAGLLAGGCESTPTPEPADTGGGNTAKAAAPAGATASHMATAAAAEPKFERTPAWDRPGYSTVLADGRVWVFPEGSVGLASFLAGNEPAKSVTRIGVGPAGTSLRSDEPETISGYLAAKPGFVTEIVDGRIWVFRPDTEALEEFRRSGEPAKSVTRPSAGPARMTVRGPDMETIVEYVAAKPGFVTRYEDERLWVFRPGSKAYAEFLASGEPAKSVTRPKAGPLGLTLRAADSETIAEYMAAADGYETFVVDGRIWVFLPGTKDLEEFRKSGEPAKSVTRVAAGPLGMTVRGPDADTLNGYLRVVAR